MSTTKCPNCRKNELRPFKGEIDLAGVVVLTQGLRCTSCGETVFDDAQVAQQEKDRATALVQRGIRTGTEFKFVRKMVGLRATELADMFDVRPETVSRWERGEVEIPRLVAFSLGELYERPLVIRRRFEALADVSR